jgi:3-phenylpropionate/cinnamic acid dioxygenase small subunit
MIDNTLLEELIDKESIKSLIHRYATACDKRLWDLCKSVFDSQVEVNYGDEFALSGRDNVVSMIKSMLGPCGASQHLIGNIEISIDGDSATASSYVRAIHASASNPAAQPYEVWAEYVDMLQRKHDSWVITHRRMIISKETGSRDILSPAPPTRLN